jgi:hypothetical protein
MKRRWIKLSALTFVIVGLVVALLLAWLSWPNSETLVGQAARGDIRGMRRSLNLGADIDGYSMWGWHRENKGETPLTSAVQHGSFESVEFLLNRGADPNQRSGSGMPPICWAAVHGRLDVAKALVENGAAPELPDVDHYGKPEKAALDYARSEGHIDVAEFLQAKSEQDGATNPRPAVELKSEGT